MHIELMSCQGSLNSGRARNICVISICTQSALEFLILIKIHNTWISLWIFRALIKHITMSGVYKNTSDQLLNSCAVVDNYHMDVVSDILFFFFFVRQLIYRHI